MNAYGSFTSVTNTRREQFVANPANDSTGGSKIVTLTCEWSERDTYTPAMLSAYSGAADFQLTSVDRQQLPNSLAQIVLTYTASYTSESVPPTTYSEQSSQIEVDIREHPDFADWEDDWDDEAGAFKPGTDKYGIKSYIKGSTTVTVAAYYVSKPSSERDGIGKKESPGGDAGSSDKWLLIGANRSKQGNYWVMAKTYLYSATSWNDDIYS